MIGNRLFALFLAIPGALFVIGLTIGVITNNPVWLLLPIACSPLIESDFMNKDSE